MRSESNANRRFRSAILPGGFSLIELMIAMVIGLAFSLAVMQVLSVAETRRRSSNSVNDIDQTAAYATYEIDKFVRSAGSGFASTTRAPAVVGNNYGCTINAALSGTAILPAPTLPAPFNNVLTDIGGKIRLAPILIDYNGSHFGTGKSDVLIVMSGSAGYSEGAMTFGSNPTSSQLNVRNDGGFNVNSPTVGDLVLLVDANSGGNVQSCMIEQINATQTPSGGTALPLAGTYYSATGTDPSGTAVASFSINGEVMNLGNPTVGSNPPLFQMLGVMEGSSSTDYALYSYDLLKISNPGVATVVADQVFEIHALYYVDTTAFNTTGYGVADAWLSPNPSVTTSINAAAGSIQYDATHLMAGTATAADALYRIKGIRLGVILRSSLSEQTAPSGPTSVTLFSGLTDPGGADLHYTRTFTGSELNYRYRVLEATIPIRNNQNCIYSPTNSC